MYSRIKLFIEKYRIDSIYAHLIRMAPYAKDLSIFKVLDLTDAICLTLERSLRYRKHIFYLFYFQEWLKVRKYEKNIVKQFDKCLLITDIEKNAIEDAKGLMNIEIIQNGVDIEKLKPSDKPYNEKKITFVGNLHSFPNRDAVLFFYNEILPLVKKQVPDIKFYIIGINPPPKILKLNEDENVVVTGPVENLKYYLDNSACFVCPIRSGAGLQNKILEAMALGLPVVTTSIGFEGIKARENEDILIADSPEEFAKKILKIIKNEKLRTRLSKNARATMEENYSWHKIKDKLEKVFKKKQNS